MSRAVSSFLLLSQRNELLSVRSFPVALVSFFALVVLLAAGAAPGQEDSRLTLARAKMVKEEVEGAGVTNPRVVKAMLTTPRHLFIPEEHRRLAYFDLALPIGEGQTISPP